MHHPTDGSVATLQVASQSALAPELVAALSSSPFGPFECHLHTDRSTLLAHLTDSRCDALLLQDDADAQAIAAKVGPEVAVLVITSTGAGPAAVIAWLQRGAQEVLTPADLTAEALARRLRAAIERKRRERDTRTAYATDLDTGLPHQQQLIEHMSQLLALREREPAPMAVLALRVEGFASAEARCGRDASALLRRKVGVRLRAGVRASDVVAALGDDAYAVLLGALLTPDDAERVGAKLVASLGAPFRVGANDIPIAVALGIGQYPQDGAQPDALLRRAVGLAAAAQAIGRAGFANFAEASNAPGGAANDD
jgi:diguanylate cyclase (GGDEF)-like protein